MAKTECETPLKLPSGKVTSLLNMATQFVDLPTKHGDYQLYIHTIIHTYVTLPEGN